MSSYLLLRNNKETGPYQLEELLAEGLKPYDLVWVQGKSAAWRYPGEVEELKPYAPMVEEQPFDRFYKKATDKKTETPAEPDPAPVNIPAVQKSIQDYSDYLPKKEATITGTENTGKVFVKMPGQDITRKPAPKKQETTIKVPVYSITEQAQEQQEYLQEYNKKPQTIGAMQEDYARKLEGRKQKMARKSHLQAILKKAAVIVGLIGMGVLVGFVIRPRNDKQDAQSVQTEAAAIVQPSTVLPEEPKDQLSNEPVQQHDQQSSQLLSQVQEEQATPKTQLDEKVVEKLTDPQPLSPKQLSTLKLTKENMVATPAMERVVEEKYAYSGSETNKTTGERQKAVRNEGSEKVITSKNADPLPVNKEPVREEKTGWINQLSLTSNEYKKVPLGGIRNLELTLTNRSGVTIDQVIVEVQYLRSNDEPVKTENVTFRSIPAKESATVRVPDTNRGVKVAYRILKVDSKAGDGLANR